MNTSLNFDNLVKLTEDKQKETFQNWIEKENFTVSQIAEMLGTYPNKIRRHGLKLGIDLPNRSKSQQFSLASGRHEHPTKGKKRSDDTKLKISENVAKSWENLSDEERQKRSDTAKELWDNKTEEEKQDFYKKANDAVRQTAREGSKDEKKFINNLIINDFKVVSHVEHRLLNDKLHIDLFLPEINTIVEIDGPSHFKPIWGEETLKKTMDADNRKNGLALAAGLCVIRIRIEKTLTQKRFRDIFQDLLKILYSIKTKYPESGKRLFIIGDK